MNISQLGQHDGEIMADAQLEVQQLVEEQVTVRHFLSRSGGNAARGIAATITYTDVITRALVASIEAKDLMGSGSIYAAGDVRCYLIDPIYGASGEGGADGQAAGRPSDLVVYRGREYRIIGNVERIHYAGTLYYAPVIRQVKAQ